MFGSYDPCFDWGAVGLTTGRNASRKCRCDLRPISWPGRQRFTRCAWVSRAEETACLRRIYGNVGENYFVSTCEKISRLRELARCATENPDNLLRKEGGKKEAALASAATASWGACSISGLLMSFSPEIGPLLVTRDKPHFIGNWPPRC